VPERFGSQWKEQGMHAYFAFVEEAPEDRRTISTALNAACPQRSSP
jgi:hypothetical protein